MVKINIPSIHVVTEECRWVWQIIDHIYYVVYMIYGQIYQYWEGHIKNKIVLYRAIINKMVPFMLSLSHTHTSLLFSWSKVCVSASPEPT